MIRERSALSRQAQAFFHRNMLGLFTWDDVFTQKPREVQREPGKPREAGKFHDELRMHFGPFDLTMLGPFESEKHPCGLIEIKCGKHTVDGPLDDATWDRVAAFIKEHNHQEEVEYGTEESAGFRAPARDDWGR